MSKRGHGGVGLPHNTLGASIGTINKDGTFTGSGPVTAVDNVVRCACASDFVGNLWVKLQYVDGGGSTSYQQAYLHADGSCFLVVDYPGSVTVDVYTGGSGGAASWGSSPIGSVDVTSMAMQASLGIDIWTDSTTQAPYASPAIALDPSVDVTMVPVNNRTGVELTVWVNGTDSIVIPAAPSSPAPTVDLTTAKYQWAFAFEEGTDDPQIVIKRPPDQITGRR